MAFCYFAWKEVIQHKSGNPIFWSGRRRSSSEGVGSRSAGLVLLNSIKTASAHFLCFCLHFCLSLRWYHHIYGSEWPIYPGGGASAAAGLNVSSADAQKASCFQVVSGDLSVDQPIYYVSSAVSQVLLLIYVFRQNKRKLMHIDVCWTFWLLRSITLQTLSRICLWIISGGIKPGNRRIFKF